MTDKQENELRPCPGCGNPPKTKEVQNFTFVFCEEEGCFCYQENYDPKLWNRIYCWKIIDQDKQAIRERDTSIKEMVKTLEAIAHKPCDCEIKGIDCCRCCGWDAWRAKQGISQAGISYD